MTNKPLYYLLIITLLLMYGCSNTKYLPEGDMLYVGGEVTVKDSLLSRKERKAMAKEMEGLLRPKPNSNVLGLRFKLYIYNLAGEPKKEKGLRHWLRTKVGEPPVLFSQVDLDYNADILQNVSENRGYFKTRTSADSVSKARRAKALYTVTTGAQYKIRNVTFPVDTITNGDSTDVILQKEIARSSRRSLLKKGDPYSLDVIKQERDRIDNRLKNRGFYYFSADNLLVRVDSTVGKNEVDLKVIVKDETSKKSKRVYTIDDIIIYPNYSLTSSEKNEKYPADSIQKYKDFKIIDPDSTFRPIIYDRTLFFHKGDTYSRRDHNLSLNRLINLGTFKFVKNDFKLSDTITSKLDVYYYFTPLPRKSIRVETLAKTNSANFNGTEVKVNWSNRNTFRAAELLTVSVFGGLDVQVSGQNKGYNVYRVGGETSLIWPRFISPIHIADSSAFVPRTKALLNYEYQKRMKLYALNSFRGQFGYLWKDNPRVEHQLNVVDINYVSPSNVTQEYQLSADTIPALQRVIDKQLIFGPSYTYTYTNTTQKRRKNTFYYKGSIETSGNVAGLAMGADAKGGDPKSILGVQFSQFVKMEHDFRHYFRLSEGSQIASRIIVGIGAPYGNSTELPFVRQFYMGGTNSLRAFRARSVGPGTYRYADANPNANSNTFLPDQGGDIKLEMNLEYRAKLFSVVNGALFVDAGNVWLWNKDPSNIDVNGNETARVGGEITSKFMSQLAVGTGAGLRFDLSFLILRLDLAFPIRKPWLPDGSRWVFDDIDFGSKSWRKENLVFNLAIGYPF